MSCYTPSKFFACMTSFRRGRTRNINEGCTSFLKHRICNKCNEVSSTFVVIFGKSMTEFFYFFNFTTNYWSLLLIKASKYYNTN